MVTHVPGRDNKFPDATSRFPSTLDDIEYTLISEVLCNILGEDSDEDNLDKLILAASEDEHVRAITWDIVLSETEKDSTMQLLIKLTKSVFPTNQKEMPESLMSYWTVRDNLYVVDGVILMRDHVVVPPSLRDAAVQDYPRGGTPREVIPVSLRRDIQPVNLSASFEQSQWKVVDIPLFLFLRTCIMSFLGSRR